jgi:CRP/FNR family cyclic AMP-dependent transcriptional regulator
MILRAAANKRRDFDTNTFLATLREGRKIVSLQEKQTVFAQGDTADAVFYIQKCKVRLTVLSKSGKGATIGILTDGDFFGEGLCWANIIQVR